MPSWAQPFRKIAIRKRPVPGRELYSYLRNILAATPSTTDQSCLPNCPGPVRWQVRNRDGQRCSSSRRFVSGVNAEDSEATEAARDLVETVKLFRDHPSAACESKGPRGGDFAFRGQAAGIARHIQPMWVPLMPCRVAPCCRVTKTQSRATFYRLNFCPPSSENGSGCSPTRRQG